MNYKLVEVNNTAISCKNWSLNQTTNRLQISVVVIMAVIISNCIIIKVVQFTTYSCENKQNLQYYITTESYKFVAKFGAGIELLTYYK